MKKKFLGLIAIVAIAVVTALSVNVKSNDKGLTELGMANAKALASDLCPNGCVDGSGGCYCNGWYPCYAEAEQQLNY